MKLSPHQLNTLKRLEPTLRERVKAGNLAGSEEVMKRIQLLFHEKLDHHRLLRCKNWYYECLIEHGRTAEARDGLEVVLRRSNEGTRLHLEASALLAVCYLRLQVIDKAKGLLKTVVRSINAIQSESRRRQFQERLLIRIDDELILSQLIGRSEGPLDPVSIHEQAVSLLQNKSPEEIYIMIGDLMPQSAGYLLADVKRHAILLLPPVDQKALPPPSDSIAKEVIGRKTEAALKRVGWRTFCDSESTVYQMWNDKIPTVFSGGYFASALVTSLAQWKIGVPQLAAGVLAIAMRFGCKEFCDTFKPEGLMIPRNEK